VVVKESLSTIRNSKPELAALRDTEVSQLIGISRSGLRQWRRRRRGPRYFRIGRLIRYQLADVQRFLDANAVETDDSSHAE